MLLHNTYDKDWLTKQQFGNGDTIQYHYDLSPHKFYAERVSLKLPDGSIKTIQIGDSVSEVFKRMR